MSNKKYVVILTIGMIVIWLLMIVVKFAEYDINYLYYVSALLVSGLFTTFIVAIRWIRREIYEKCLFFTYILLFTSSPISLQLFIILYVEFIGQYFKF